jgi:DNA-directed RNA polymerase specialized sigma24 family protein
MSETRWSLLIVDDSSSGKKSWKLTQKAFDNLLARLDPDRNTASDKYEILRFKLVMFFERRACLDPQALTNETIDRVSRRLEEGQVIEDLTRYAYGVAKLVYMEYLKALEEERKMLANLPPPDAPEPEPDPEAGFQLQLKMNCLKSCLNRLSDDERDLIIRYYPEKDSEKINSRKKLAEEKGVQLNALRIRAHRIRKRLEKCIRKCIKDSPPG